MLLRGLAPSNCYPDREQPESRTQRINEHVHDLPLPRRDESLVEFISDGVERSQPKREAGSPPRKTLDCVSGQATEEQHSQNRILRNVCSFADVVDDGFEALLGNVRHQPTDDRCYNPRRSLAGRFVARCRKYNGEPNDDRQPILEEGAGH